MASRHIKQFTFEDFMSKDDMLKMTKFWLAESIKAIQSGRVIRKGYAASTKKRRASAGLQTNHVDLTGNNRYSRKGWRLLQSIGISAVNSRSAKIIFKSDRAATLYSYQAIRYGKIF